MIKLYQFAPAPGWEVPNLSPFCVKVETYLKLAGLPYEVVHAIPPGAPKGKLPFIDDDGERVADSGLIIDYLRRTYGDSVDGHLAPAERAVSAAMQSLIEDHLFWSFMYARWAKRDRNWLENKRAIFGGMPPVVRDLVGVIARRRIRSQIWGQGMGRHAESEIYELGRKDLDALSDFLGDRTWFMGDRPTTLDALGFGLLANIVWVPIESPLKEHVKSLSNLTAFCERLRARCYA